MTEDFDIRSAAAEATSLLTGRYTLSTAESCTGGLLGGALTDAPGASKFFLGGAVVYSYGSKEKVLGVDRKILEQFGAVSAEAAKEMAEGAAEAFGSDLSVAVTGIAGPEGATPQKAVGTVFIAVSDGKNTEAREFRIPGDRGRVREGSVWHALRLLSEFVSDLP
ncbi:MAG: nicotinamide-nucleotide amidohydrolase family protein [Candidatus Methanoplasma sp.]|jgi:PncC family amidohydrolase|nr:nicotinamide-nucleotide amidohydrolase family protein [Candidatus Methanoplasma sp.]